MAEAPALSAVGWEGWGAGARTFAWMNLCLVSGDPSVYRQVVQVAGGSSTPEEAAAALQSLLQMGELDCADVYLAPLVLEALPGAVATCDVNSEPGSGTSVSAIDTLFRLGDWPPETAAPLLRRLLFNPAGAIGNDSPELCDRCRKVALLALAAHQIDSHEAASVLLDYINSLPPARCRHASRAP